MILVCGGTGLLGSRVVAALCELGTPVRVLVRPGTDASGLEPTGAELVRGDLRDPASLRAAVAGARTVVSTANSVARTLGGERGLSIRDVDDRGHASLVRAAEDAGVSRFVYLSFVQELLDSGSVLARAKLATEDRLRRSRLEEVVVRPGMFQEVWLESPVGLDWRRGRATILGRGLTPHRYVAVDDVAAVVVHAVEAPSPARVIEFDGPEALTREQVVRQFEQETGQAISTRHVPRAALAAGAVLLRRTSPVLSSLMQQALTMDRQPSVATDAPLRALGLVPRPASRYIADSVTHWRGLL